MADQDQDAAFDKIMEMVGNDGPFQQRFNYIYNGGVVFMGALAFMNIILALNVPEHWCSVDGRQHTNYTLDQWKHLTLPRYFAVGFKCGTYKHYARCYFDEEKFQ